jgi:hypothetical protein
MGSTTRITDAGSKPTIGETSLAGTPCRSRKHRQLSKRVGAGSAWALSLRRLTRRAVSDVESVSPRPARDCRPHRPGSREDGCHAARSSPHSQTSRCRKTGATVCTPFHTGAADWGVPDHGLKTAGSPSATTSSGNRSHIRCAKGCSFSWGSGHRVRLLPDLGGALVSLGMALRRLVSVRWLHTSLRLIRTHEICLRAACRRA